jgi:TrpR family trp operon transcriptional repressor
MGKLTEISKVLAKTNDPKLVEGFLKSILTPKEADEISSRWSLVCLLDDGMSQRKIAKKLHVSLCKITRGSRELKKTNSPFKHMLHKFKK